MGTILRWSRCFAAGDSDDVAIRAIIGPPFMLLTVAMALVGITVIAFNVET